MIVFEKWILTKNLTENLTDADARVTTIAQLFFSSKSRAKNVDIKFSVHDTFLEYITFIRYAQNRKIGELNNLKL